MHEKNMLRKDYIKKRNKLDNNYKYIANNKITSYILSLDQYKLANTIFIYHSKAGEFDTRNLIKLMLEERKIVGLPKIIDIKSKELKFYEYQKGDELEKNIYSIFEPKANNEYLLNVENADIIILPCVTASSAGVRLGYGGGFYDKLLSSYDGVSILPIYEKLICENIPVEEHDQRVKIVVSELGIKKIDNFYYQ